MWGATGKSTPPNNKQSTQPNRNQTKHTTKQTMNKMKTIKTKEAAIILARLMKDCNIYISWGPHDIKEIPGGISFQVQGFIYSGEVTITVSKTTAGKFCFTVKIGGKENQVKGGELVDYIDKRVEFVENYEQAVKDSMTDEEFEMFSGIRHIVIL